ELDLEYPDGKLWETLGERAGVEALIADFYRRMAEDEVLRHAFPFFNPAPAAEFFIQWFGGDRGYSDGLEGGLVRRHQERYVGPGARREGPRGAGTRPAAGPTARDSWADGRVGRRLPRPPGGPCPRARGRRRSQRAGVRSAPDGDGVRRRAPGDGRLRDPAGP